MKDLEEGKIYTLTFDKHEQYSNQKILCVEIIVKLKKTIKMRNLDTNEIKWYRIESSSVEILDEVPIKYFRKEKLKK